MNLRSESPLHVSTFELVYSSTVSTAHVSPHLHHHHSHIVLRKPSGCVREERREKRKGKERKKNKKIKATLKKQKTRNKTSKYMKEETNKEKITENREEKKRFMKSK